MTIVLFDHQDIQSQLLPFTYTRAVCDIRCGIMTIKEKWEKFTGLDTIVLTQEYLEELYQSKIPKGEKVYINASLCPDKEIWEIITELGIRDGIQRKGMILAYKSNEIFDIETLSKKDYFDFSEYFGKAQIIDYPWKIFGLNASQIRADFKVLTDGRKSEIIEDPHTIVYNKSQIFIEEGAKIKAAILNAENGPIYIGKNAHIEEGAIIRGAFALCEGATVNTGAKIRGDSTVGPYSKVGGEVSNSVIFGYSNKGHDGFIGNTVIGEWCNLGADTNTSNLKNNYTDIKLWNYSKGRFIDTGEQFCGLMMGDHSKCGINTMFNTGTVVGVGANIFGAGFPANFIPSFFWGGAQTKMTFQINKMLETAEIVMKRRSVKLSTVHHDILNHVFHLSAKYRPWDKK